MPLAPQAANTDRELWRGPDESKGSYYADSIHVTEGGAIGIDVGGFVIVMPLRDWHALAVESAVNRAIPLDVGKIEAFPPESDLPDWEDLRGRAPDATGDLSSEAFVRELRSGWR